MVVPLDDDELVPLAILARDVPRFTGRRRVLHAAYAEPGALPDRVEGKPDVAADLHAFGRTHRPRRAGQVPVEEIAERPLTDEADPRRVLLRVDRNARLARDPAHLRLRVAREREDDARELGLGETMEEVALVLRRVGALHQLEAPIRLADAGVVAGR